ncbi:carbonic anhydrase [Paraburkholderia sp. LEh10]|uniref:carbonic anhydrase n=1 Tax=Paraburkholderia sp. LEh10 TaxID=2821353 RepID=UPI001AE43D58|nr:carbonic anhydrase [Paraburkholderia sp. LEh10]MBP0595664.1 carbonic anhydrase [Paraburkholderia sp. LEh10]
MNRTKHMLLQNIAWSSESAQRDPAFFAGLARGQSPKVLWIGCSDSRVPAEIVTNCTPGELFVHRNIANLFSTADDNAMSVLEYAVQVLKVDDIIVCGHYGCGGVSAALQPVPSDLPHVARRISPLCVLAGAHKAQLAQCASEDDQVDRLAELNVIAQVQTIRATSIVRNAAHSPAVHGWIFGLHDGRITLLAPGGRHTTHIASGQRVASLNVHPHSAEPVAR